LLIKVSNSKGRFEVVNVTNAGSLTVKTTFKGEGEFAYHATARKILVFMRYPSVIVMFTFEFVQG